MTRLDLSLAVSKNARTEPLTSGRVGAEGLDLQISTIHPSEMFWRQLKFAEFDASEMSMSSLLIATAKGDNSWAAIPVFTTRAFFHTNILVRKDAKIERPEDLRGKRVGVPEYQQTAAIWSRGILQHEFGVSPQDIRWRMERDPAKSHGGSTGFTPPPGVELTYMGSQTDIGQMMVSGELDATLLYIADKNLVDRSQIDLLGHPDVRRLFPDPAAEGRRYFAKTGIFPINHTLVVRRSLLEKHPWIALNLYSAFAAAKDEVAQVAKAYNAAYVDTGLTSPPAVTADAVDPLAYGIKGPRATLEAIADYVFEQGLTPRRVQLEEIFAPSTMDL